MSLSTADSFSARKVARKNVLGTQTYFLFPVCIYLFIYLFMYFLMYLLIYLFTCLFTYLFTYLLIYLFTYLFIYLTCYNSRELCRRN